MKELFYVVRHNGRYIVRDKEEHRTLICTSEKDWVLKSFRRFVERYSFVGIESVLDGLAYRNNRHDKERIKYQFSNERDEEMERELERIIKEIQSCSKEDGIPLMVKKTKKRKIIKKKKITAGDMIDIDILL